MFQQESLEQIIARLISQKQEGDFWDFKQEWHDDKKNADLVKDIICFANSIHQHDCYLIFGVDNSYNIVGMEHARRTQANIVDLLSHIQWSGDNIPHISVKTIIIENTSLDILIVHNTPEVPFYLKKDYQYDAHRIRQGVIYSREKDRNTGWNEIASPLIVEKLWKKRFHLHEPIIEQMNNLLAHVDEWDNGPDNLLYHRYRPEFTICKKPYDEGNIYEEFFVEYMIDHKAFSHVYQLKYNESTLKDIYLLYLDGCRFITPYPKIGINHAIPNSHYFYIVKGSEDWYLQSIFNKDSGDNHEFFQKMFYQHIILFASEAEKEDFYYWCDNNPQRMEDAKKGININRDFKCESYKADAFATEVIKRLLEQYRAEIEFTDDRPHLYRY